MYCISYSSPFQSCNSFISLSFYFLPNCRLSLLVIIPFWTFRLLLGWLPHVSPSIIWLSRDLSLVMAACLHCLHWHRIMTVCVHRCIHLCVCVCPSISESVSISRSHLSVSVSVSLLRRYPSASYWSFCWYEVSEWNDLSVVIDRWSSKRNISN